MAHLSERHEFAKRRRDELIRGRSLALVIRTGYPATFHSSKPARAAMQLPASTVAETLVSETKKYSDEDLAAARLRCEERLKSARDKESRARRLHREHEQAQQVREQSCGSDAAAMAAQRIRDRKHKERRLEEEEIDLLISQQTSSIKAMNIARLLSPRFEERVEFTPSVTKYSSEEERVVHLLTNQRVGTFYQ